MIGLTVLLVLGLYIWAGYETVKRLQTKKAKIIAAAVYVLIPTWDIVPGRLYFNYLCKNHGGEKIYKTAENVVGVYQEGTVLDNGTLLRGKSAYQFVERLRSDISDVNKKLARTTLDASGTFQTVMLPLDQRLSRYSLGREPNVQLYSNLFHILFVEYTITDLQTNAIMAKDITFIYGGGWVSRFLSSLGGSGHAEFEQCPPYYGGPEFVFKVLTPSK